MNKYDKLTADLIRAREAAERASRVHNDPNKCFFVSGGVTAYLPRYNREMVLISGERAGVRCGIFERYGVKEWGFSAKKFLMNEQAFEYLKAFEKELKFRGYVVTTDYNNYKDLDDYLRRGFEKT